VFVRVCRVWHARGQGFKSPQLHSPSAQVEQFSPSFTAPHVPPVRLSGHRTGYPDAGHLAGSLTVYLHNVTNGALTTSGGTLAGTRPPRPTRTFG
jgi:hypothetical protein